MDLRLLAAQPELPRREAALWVPAQQAGPHQEAHCWLWPAEGAVLALSGGDPSNQSSSQPKRPQPMAARGSDSLECPPPPFSLYFPCIWSVPYSPFIKSAFHYPPPFPSILSCCSFWPLPPLFKKGEPLFLLVMSSMSRRITLHIYIYIFFFWTDFKRKKSKEN